jgi:anti-sigma regulatory factor (Ser/Thr protein kinase)
MAQDLVHTVSTVVAAAKANRYHEQVADSMSEARWSFVLDSDAALIPTLVEHARRDLARLRPCDETTQTRLGIALHEALVNAIDHGNLELSSDLREQDDRTYHELAQQRRNLPPYKGRRVFVTIRVTRHEARYTVRDEGPGFDPSGLPDPTDPANLERVFGRGLLLIRTFMDEVRHNETGNEITMVKLAPHVLSGQNQSA